MPSEQANQVNPDNKVVVLGKFGAAYGVRGWLHLISYTDPIKNILNYPQWHVKHRKKWITLAVEDSKAHNKGLIVKLKGIDNRELAREYTNDLITIDRQALPPTPEAEYYWQDLKGATVISKKGTQLGTVTDLIATGANDVLVVNGERERLIPYTNDVILSVNKTADKTNNKTNKTIIVDWEPGF